MLYECIECNFVTHLLSNYKQHTKTKKHLRNTENKPCIDIPQRKGNHICKYCNRSFTHIQSMYRHIKYSCEKNKDEDLKELVRLMNLQLENQKTQMEETNKELEYQKQQNKKQQRQIEKLMGKLQVNHITNNTMNIQNNIQLLSYKDTDMSHLTNKDYEVAIKKVNLCVLDIIEKIHFNPEKPENMNIFISNMKDKYIMVYEDGNWNIKNKINELDELYDNKEMLLEDWLNEYGTDSLRKKYEKYTINKHNIELFNSIKDEVKMMLYNKKTIIEN